jgi:hypothetical protein
MKPLEHARGFISFSPKTLLKKIYAQFELLIQKFLYTSFRNALQSLYLQQVHLDYKFRKPISDRRNYK